jgi:RND family efflux transporter MFP subunit
MLGKTETMAPQEDGRLPSTDVSRLRIQRANVNSEPRRTGPIIIALFVGAVLVASVLAYLRFSSGMRPIEVTTAVVLAPDVDGGGGTVLTASGYIVARRKAGVGAKVPGLLEYLGVEEGSKVEEGQVIGRLQARDVAADLEAARSALQEARSNLAEAESLLTQYRKEFDRARALVRDGVVSNADYDVAEARLHAQEARVHSQDSAITTAQARVRAWEVALEDRIIRAPFSGTVLTKDAEEGETVAPAAAGVASTRGSIVTMADLESLEVEVDVNESYIARLQHAQPARIVADSFPERVYEGKIRQVIPTADRQKATVQVKVSILDPGDMLRPDMGAKVTFLSPLSPGSSQAAAAHPLPRVTSRAIVTGPDGIRRAWVVEKETVHPVRVDVAREEGGVAEIRAGLSGGEMVVTDPPTEIAEGRRIRVKS